MNSKDLLDIAERLASGTSGNRQGRPKQAELGRAISTAYYAMFHTLAKHSADLMVGSTSKSRSNEAWRQLYRSLDHGEVKKRHSQNPYKRILKRFPQGLQDFTSQFVKMQRLRHAADYDPLERFSRSTVVQLIEETRTAIAQFEAVSRKDRIAFAAFVLHRVRNN